VGILDKVAASVDVSVSAAGQLITVFALANAIGTPIIMMVMAKMDRRTRLLLALADILLGCLLVSVPGFAFLMVSYIILGVGCGVFVVTAYATAADLAPSGRQGRAMSNVSLGFSASLVFSVPIGRVVAAAYDWKVLFWAIAIFTLLGIFAVVRVIPSSKGEAPVPIGKQFALLKNPKIAFFLGVTLFVFIGYSMMNTYITPFLTSVVSVGEQSVSFVLFALGISSLIGSKLGGFLSDRIGTARTLFCSMFVHAVVLTLLSIVGRSTAVGIPLLMLWAIAAWTFGPTQNFNLLSLAPEASGIVLSLNSSFVQLGFAVGAAIGGIAVGSSVQAISWIAAISVALAICIASISFGLNRTFSKRTAAR